MYTIAFVISTLAAVVIPFYGLNIAMFNLQEVTPLSALYFVLVFLGTVQGQAVADFLSALIQNTQALILVVILVKIACVSAYISTIGLDILLGKVSDLSQKIISCAGSSKSSSFKSFGASSSNCGKKVTRDKGNGNGGSPPPPPPGPPPSEPPPPPPTKRSDVDEISEEVLSIFIEVQALFAMVKQVYKLSRPIDLDQRFRANNHILNWLYGLRVEIERRAKSVGLTAAQRREPKHLYDFGINEMYDLLDKILKYEDLCKRDLRDHGEFLEDAAMSFVYRPMEKLREDIMIVLGSLSYLERERAARVAEVMEDADKVASTQSSPASVIQECTYLLPSTITHAASTSPSTTSSFDGGISSFVSTPNSSLPSPITPSNDIDQVKIKVDETFLLDTTLDIPDDSFDWGYDNHFMEIPKPLSVAGLAIKKESQSSGNKGIFSLFDQSCPFNEQGDSNLSEFDGNASKVSSQHTMVKSSSRKSQCNLNWSLPSFKIAKRKPDEKNIDTRNILADLNNLSSSESTVPVVFAISQSSSNRTIPQSASKWFGQRVRTLFGDRRAPQAPSGCKTDIQNAPPSSTSQNLSSPRVALDVLKESVEEVIGVSDKAAHVKAKHTSGTELLQPSSDHSKGKLPSPAKLNNELFRPLSMNHDVDIVPTDPQTRFAGQDASLEGVKIPFSLPGSDELESELPYIIDRRRGIIFPTNIDGDTPSEQDALQPSSPPSLNDDASPIPIHVQNASPPTAIALQIIPNTPELNVNGGDKPKPALLDQNKLHERWISTAEVSHMPTEDYNGGASLPSDELPPLEVVVTFSQSASPFPSEALPTFTEIPKPRREFLIPDAELAPYIKRVRACAVKTSMGVTYPGVPRVSDAELAPYLEKARALIAASKRPSSPEDDEPILPHSEFVKEMQARLDTTRTRAVEESVKVFFGRPLRASFGRPSESISPEITTTPASPSPHQPTSPVISVHFPKGEGKVPVAKVAPTTATSSLPQRRSSLPVGRLPQPTPPSATSSLGPRLFRHGSSPESRLRAPASRRSSILPVHDVYEQSNAPPPAAPPAMVVVPAVTPKVQPRGSLKRPSIGNTASRIATAPRSSLSVSPALAVVPVTKTASPTTRTAPIKSMTTPTPNGGLRKPAPRSSLRPPSISSATALRLKTPSPSPNPNPTTGLRPLKLKNQENIRPSSNNLKTEVTNAQAPPTVSPPKVASISTSATSKLRRPSVKGFSLLQPPKCTPKVQF
ncbi:hypothetical protein BDN72DRAFT_846797 [Pluteus cervinus]|uniref:Uncharacterized protein n=1 Tax=Pluteus cervinus TaxID=181527 RepID=A0ACD3AEA7_9AGAR|nr:hypothetical protein BDN72DRAFT_846797 [Pluteus cervinus]